MTRIFFVEGLDVIPVPPPPRMQVSRWFYVLAHHQDLWRTLVLRDFSSGFDFLSSWKDTYALMSTSARPSSFVLCIFHFRFSRVNHMPRVNRPAMIHVLSFLSVPAPFL